MKLSENTLILIIIIFTLSISLSSFVYRCLDTPQDLVYLGTHFYSNDHSIYAGNMLQGARGRWLLYDQHTTEPHSPYPIHIEYLLWGKLVGGLFKFDPIFTFHLSRLFFGALLLLSLYLFFKEIFPPKMRLIAFGFSTLFGSLPNITKTENGWIIKPFMQWFTEIDVTQRFGLLMHYQIGAIGLILGVTFLLRLWRTKRLKNLLWAILVVLPASFSHPVSVVTLYLSSGLFFFGLFLIALFRKKLNEKYLLFVICYWLFVILTAWPFLINRYYINQFPFTYIAGWEKATQYLIPLLPLLFAIGPTVFLTPLALLPKRLSTINYQQPVRRQAGSTIFSLSLLFASYLLIFYLHSLLGINRVRFLQVPLWLPFSILATDGLFNLSFLIRKIFPKLSLKYIFYPLFYILLLITVPTSLVSLGDNFKMYHDHYPLIYPTKKWYQAVVWLKENTAMNDDVLSAYIAGTIIPAHAGNTVYIGHPWSTIDLQEKEARVGKFFSAQMSPDEAKKFLVNHNLKYVFYGYQETSYQGDLNKYADFLIPVFANQEAIVYKVSNL